MLDIWASIAENNDICLSSGSCTSYTVSLLALLFQSRKRCNEF